MKPGCLQSLARLTALIALLLFAAAPARTADGSGYGASGRVVELGIGKSYVVNLPANAAEVLVADPKIANAVVRSARKAYVIGIAVGETDIIFFDAEGRQIESLAVSVARDMSPIRNNIRTSIPEAVVSANAIGESVMLTGSVKSAGEAKTAADIAANLVGGADKVVNAIAIENREQIMLKVSVVEMQRTVAKQFGINWDFNKTMSDGSFDAINDPVSFASPISVIRGDFTWGGNTIEARLEALESNGLIRTLAEPNLMAISGEKAEFLAGGEFPVQIDTDDGTSIEFKDFGVSLAFTPVVLSTGRISLQIVTGVSEIDPTINPSVCCGLKTRRAMTTVELPSGGSLAIAGLLQEKTDQVIKGMPGLINLPVLGTLFRSRDFQKGQSELVVIVTPYLAKHTSREKLARPDDGYTTPSDLETIFLGQLNKIYAPAMSPKGHYKGPIGHIVE